MTNPSPLMAKPPVNVKISTYIVCSLQYKIRDDLNMIVLLINSRLDDDLSGCYMTNEWLH